MPRLILTQRYTHKPFVLNENRRLAKTIPRNGFVPWTETNDLHSISWPLPHTQIKIQSLNSCGKTECFLCFIHKRFTQDRFTPVFPFEQLQAITLNYVY